MVDRRKSTGSPASCLSFGPGQRRGLLGKSQPRRLSLVVTKNVNNLLKLPQSK